MADFGEIVDGTFVLSPEQVESRKYGFSDIKSVASQRFTMLVTL